MKKYRIIGYTIPTIKAEDPQSAAIAFARKIAAGDYGRKSFVNSAAMVPEVSAPTRGEYAAFIDYSRRPDLARAGIPLRVESSQWHRAFYIFFSEVKA